MCKRRALVAEDSSYILLSLEMVLEQNDVEVVGASATLAGISKLAETVAADVAILDVNLNGEMVFPAADRLIERGIPVIFTTGFAPEEIFPPRFAGTPTLQKPFEPDKLMSMVEDAFARAEPAKQEIT